MAKFERAIVVGASSGIGYELAVQLAQSGCLVAAVARRKERLIQLQNNFPENILIFTHDVTHFDEVPGIFQEITGALGGLDLVIYSSGVMPPVEEDEFNLEKDKCMIEVNLLGAMAWLNQAAIRFGNVGHGTIVGIGSVAGDRGRAGQPAYNTSKSALATYLECLRNRLSRKGVRVVTIKPGPVQTEMTHGLQTKGAMQAEEAARIIIKKIHKNGEVYLKLSHQAIFYFIKRIPSPLFRRLRI